MTFPGIMILGVSSEIVLKYIGYAVGILFIIYISSQFSNSQMNVAEGFALKGLTDEDGDDDDEDDVKVDKVDDKKGKDLDELIKFFKTLVKAKKKTISLDNYKDKYDDLITTFEESCDYEIIEMISKGPSPDFMEELSKMCSAKENLTKAREILNSK
jgi:hypothetical protein